MLKFTILFRSLADSRIGYPQDVAKYHYQMLRVHYAALYFKRLILNIIIAYITYKTKYINAKPILYYCVLNKVQAHP